MLEGVWLSQAGRKLWLQEGLSETQMEKQDWSEREKKEISFGFEGEKGPKRHKQKSNSDTKRRHWCSTNGVFVFFCSTSFDTNLY